MKKAILLASLLAIVLIAPAWADPLSDVVSDLIAKHGSACYARSFDGDKQGALGSLGVDVAHVGLGGKAVLKVSVDFNAAYTREDTGTKVDEDLIFGLGVGGRVMPKNNPDFAIKGGLGWMPGFHGCWYLGATLKI